MSIPVQTDLLHTEAFSMRYARFGSGSRSLLILPGLSLRPVTPSAQSVAQLFSGFTEEYTVWLFDRREDVSEGHTVDQLAEETYTAARALGIRSAAVYGASQGGMLAQSLAASHPDFVTKLALASTQPRAGEMSVSVIGHWAELARRGDVSGLIDDMLEHVYSERTLKPYKAVLTAFYRDLNAGELLQFSRLADACCSFDCFDRLQQIRCPVSVTGSLGDRVLSCTGSREIAGALGCGCYLYGEDWPHAVYDEAPDFISRLQQYLL